MPAFNFASFGVALIAVLMLLFGMVLGTKIGSELAKNCINHKDYWIAHLKILVIGVVISAFVCWLNLIVLAGIPIGAMASAITVLKMDFGESVGAWKLHDKFFRVNKDHVQRGKTKQSRRRAEEVRRSLRDNTDMPEYISVSDK